MTVRIYWNELQTLLAVADEVAPEEPPVKRTGGTGSLTPEEFMEDQRRDT